MLLHEIFPGELLPTEATRKGDCTMQLQVPGEIVTGDLDEAGATEQPGLEIAQVEEGKEVDGDEHNGVEDQPHLRGALPVQHLHLPLSIPPGGGDNDCPVAMGL